MVTGKKLKRQKKAPLSKQHKTHNGR